MIKELSSEPTTRLCWTACTWQDLEARGTWTYSEWEFRMWWAKGPRTNFSSCSRKWQTRSATRCAGRWDRGWLDKSCTLNFQSRGVNLCCSGEPKVSKDFEDPPVRSSLFLFWTNRKCLTPWQDSPGQCDTGRNRRLNGMTFQNFCWKCERKSTQSVCAQRYLVQISNWCSDDGHTHRLISYRICCWRR